MNKKYDIFNPGKFTRGFFKIVEFDEYPIKGNLKEHRSMTTYNIRLYWTLDMALTFFPSKYQVSTKNKLKIE